MVCIVCELIELLAFCLWLSDAVLNLTPFHRLTFPSAVIQDFSRMKPDLDTTTKPAASVPPPPTSDNPVPIPPSGCTTQSVRGSVSSTSTLTCESARCRPSQRPHGESRSSSSSSSATTIMTRSELQLLFKSLSLSGGGQRAGQRDHQVSDRELFMLLFTVLESVSSLAGNRGTSRVPSTLQLLQSVVSLFEDLLLHWMQLHQNDSSSSLKIPGGSVGGSGSSRSSAASSDRSTPGADSDQMGYNGVLHLARLTLRLWLKMVSQVQRSSLQEQHLQDLQPLLYGPLKAISKACYNLQQVGIFKGVHQVLDQEFTLIILEGMYSALYVVNFYPSTSICQVENFCYALRDTLTDGCQEWFAYLCSKLHGISELVSSNSTVKQDSKEERESPTSKPMLVASSDWSVFLDYSHNMLAHILAELLTSSSLIKTSQQALKQALVSPTQKNLSPSSSVAVGNIFKPSNLSTLYPFSRKLVTYSLEVATGFDKLVFRLSKMAELLLSIFKDQPRVQLLSLKLLSETTKDMVGAIGSFLSSIADPNIYKNPDILDPYLEMLEEIWFRLSPDYGGSTPWWKKLANYLVLLMECEHEVVCQVIYHLQCLFSHESNILKTELTSCVIIPYHQHIMSMVKTKCFKPASFLGSKKEKSPSPEASSTPTSQAASVPPQKKGKSPVPVLTQTVQVGCEDELSHEEKVTLALFMKLLVKVVSHTRSLGTFASNGTNLYSLFLLFPLDSFRQAGVRVLEECLCTIQRFGTSSAMSDSASTSPNGSISSSPVSSSMSSLHSYHTQQAELSSSSFQRRDSTGIQTTLLHVLLSMAYSVEISHIPSRCLAIAEGRATLHKYGLAEADEVHSLLQRTFEHSNTRLMLRESFISHISIMADIWSLLARMTIRDESAAKILRANHIWDVVQVFGHSLANVLSRINQRQMRNTQDLKDHMREVKLLQERSVSLLADLLTLAHYMCWNRELRVSQ